MLSHNAYPNNQIDNMENNTKFGVSHYNKKQNWKKHKKVPK